MKRTFFLAASFVLSISASKVNAQLASYSVPTPQLTANAYEEGSTKHESLAGVNTMVSENFSKKFPGVGNVIWTKVDRTTFGYFKQQGVPVRVSYNNKGKLLYTIRYYNDAQVSPIIRDAVTREGYVMPIVHVTEIKSRYATTHLVIMEDENSIVTVTVGPGGNVTPYQELSKG